VLPPTMAERLRPDWVVIILLFIGGDGWDCAREGRVGRTQQSEMETAEPECCAVVQLDSTQWNHPRSSDRIYGATSKRTFSLDSGLYCAISGGSVVVPAPSRNPPDTGV